MKIRALAPIALLFSIWSGCGNDDDGGSTGAGSTAADCAGAARQLCAKIQSCAPFLFQASYGASIDRCELGSKLSCEQSTQAPGTKTTLSNLGACSAALNALSCDALLDSFNGGQQPDACKNIPGDLADDTACYSGSQCSGSRCVLQSADADCGKCASFTKIGADCSKAGSRCEEGSYCDGKVCAKQLDEGGSCPTGNECKDSLTCAEGKCAKPKLAKKGEACGSSAGGASCDIFAGLTCLPSDLTDPKSPSTCVEVKLAAAGAACGLIDGGVTSCEAGGDCDKTSKKCVAAPKEGEACDPQSGPGCLEPAECKAGKCTLPAAPTCK